MAVKTHYQGRNARVLCELGEIKSAHEINLNLPKRSEAVNGVRIEKSINVTGSLKARGRLMHALLAKATANGELSPPVRFEFMTLDVAEDNGGDALCASLSAVDLHLPESISFNRIDGSDDLFEFPFDVVGEAIVNGLLVNPDNEEGGI
ncbi:MAG: hypothetical protein RRB13_11840 [bacterium]|nr:hypothetical protein [bacterium]